MTSIDARASDDVSVERTPAPAVSRALQILTLLEQADGQPMPLGDIARGIAAAKSSTSNLCQVLEDGRMITRTATGYVLGRRTVELGGAFIARFNQIREFYDSRYYKSAHSTTRVPRHLRNLDQGNRPQLPGGRQQQAKARFVPFLRRQAPSPRDHRPFE